MADEAREDMSFQTDHLSLLVLGIEGDPSPGRRASRRPTKS
jgi:hypothetical protein